MSLDELLKDVDYSSAWKAQRKKLLRIIGGVSVVAVALLMGTYIMHVIRERKIQDQQGMSAQQQREVKALAKLLTLQKETKSLQDEVNDLRKTASVANLGAKGAGTNHRVVRRNSRKAAEPVTNRVQIVSYDPGDGFAPLVKEGENLYIPTGAVFRARLVTPIKTSLQKTFVLAQTTDEFRMDMKRRIPKGSRLIGRARLNPILKGVIVEFDTLVLPSGIETSISGLGLSRNALPEIDGLYFSDDLQNYGTALAFGFLSGFSDAARGRESTFFGSQPEQTLNNQVLGGLSTASFQVAEEILRDIRNRAIEYVVVPAGEPVFVALTRRYNLVQGGSK